MSDKRAAAVLSAVAVLPVLVTIFEVLRSPRLNFADYWWFVEGATHPDGSLDPAGLLKQHNGHPTFIPRLVFWAEARYLGGNNHALGLLTVVLSLVVLVVLHRMLPRDLSTTNRFALTAAFSFLLFGSRELELYGVGVTGATWLLMAVPGVLALLYAHRGQTVRAMIAVAVACACFGAGFALWPVIALIAWLRRDALWQIVAPLVVLVVAGGAWALTFETDSLQSPHPLGPENYLSVLTGTLGQQWAYKHADFAVVAGAVIGVLLFCLIAVALKRRDAETAAWIGLGLWGVLIGVMIAITRVGSGVEVALAGRFALAPVLATAAVLVLLAVYKPGLPVLACSLVVCVATYALGTHLATAVRALYFDQRVLEVAMHVGANKTITELGSTPAVVSRLKGMRSYPFNDAFGIGCGTRLGAKVGALRELSTGAVDSGPVTGDAKISGWAMVDGRPVDCVLVVDGAGIVQGGGAVGMPRPDVQGALQTRQARLGWRAVAIPGIAGASVVVGSGGVLYRLPTVRGA
ncbi:hypothetical protein [Allokutzneria albata]|uniref:4-amino-4-deoxy-L-arabinose transferase n=1 Tax=Allokutzneria albata TaxID=211114 RepID=A0A1H0A2S3_ALLAB|nr:hypothetical protein [Allokutzneria albata]SDN27604.1 hypothetical protein SAMN04489726_5838 [Allokutzneria albata]